jgi:hypothetical protein
MNPFDFFRENCGKSAIYFYLSFLLMAVVLIFLASVNNALDCLFSSSYFETYRTALAEFGLLIAVLVVRKVIVRCGERRKRSSLRAPLSQNELRAARSKLLGNQNFRRL